MTFNVPPSPAQYATLSKDGYVHLRVATGTLLLAQNEDTLLMGGGLALVTGDGVVSLHFPKQTRIWLMGGSGGSATGEILFP